MVWHGVAGRGVTYPHGRLSLEARLVVGVEVDHSDRRPWQLAGLHLWHAGAAAPPGHSEGVAFQASPGKGPASDTKATISGHVDL